MKLLFVGESWFGSSARSLKEALHRVNDRRFYEIDEINEDLYVPKAHARWLRVAHRILAGAYRIELENAILAKCREFKPDVFMVYKGSHIDLNILRIVKNMDIYTVNIFPDYSPHVYGNRLQKALGVYDLVISTKPFHSALWQSEYRYSNRCVFVAHGYDPMLHLNSGPSTDIKFDVVMIATYRPEYGRLLIEFLHNLGGYKLKVAIGGYGWNAIRGQLPNDWFLSGAVHGRDYISLLRSGKICIAPLNQYVVINGQRQQGDVDTTRTYELAAACCFFIHQRTGYVRELYESAGVPMFDDGAELANHVIYYLNAPAERLRIALAAHQRAVPAFSTDVRAAEIHSLLERELHLEAT